MPNLNKTEIIGHTGSVAELRFTPGGKPVSSFSVAVNRRYTTSDGEKKEETDWYTVVVWNRLAENCSQYIVKGQCVYASGRVRLHEWDNQEGEHRSRLELIANSVLFLDKRKQAPEAEEDLNPDDIPY